MVPSMSVPNSPLAIHIVSPTCSPSIPDGSLKWRFQSTELLGAVLTGNRDRWHNLFWRRTQLLGVTPRRQSQVANLYQQPGPVKGSASIGADGTVYFGANDGNIYAVNPDGSIKWKFSIGSPVAIIGSSPAIGADGTIYINVYPFGPNRLYAIGHGVPPTPTPTPTPVPVKLEDQTEVAKFRHRGDRESIRDPNMSSCAIPKGARRRPVLR